MRVNQEPADAGECTLGRPLFTGDDEDRMRTRGPQCGRQPADQERQVGGLDVDVFSQEADRAVACRNRKAHAGRTSAGNECSDFRRPAIRWPGSRSHARWNRPDRGRWTSPTRDNRPAQNRLRPSLRCRRGRPVRGWSPISPTPTAIARPTRNNAASASARLRAIPTHDTLDDRQPRSTPSTVHRAGGMADARGDPQQFLGRP